MNQQMEVKNSQTKKIWFNPAAIILLIVIAITLFIFIGSGYYWVLQNKFIKQNQQVVEIKNNNLKTDGTNLITYQEAFQIAMQNDSFKHFNSNGYTAELTKTGSNILVWKIKANSLQPGDADNDPMGLTYALKEHYVYINASNGSFMCDSFNRYESHGPVCKYL